MFVLCTAAQSVPGFATAPALIFIATYFLRNIKDIDWDDISEYVPAALAAIIMPLTYSIAYGIAIGFVSYVLIKALSGKGRSLNYASIGLAVVSALFFVVKVNS
jgi:AGZA family xanthine/uracil permease-like MFS transporter